MGARRLQEGGSVSNAEDKNVTIYFDDNVPDETLVCDLFYEKDWAFRRRFSKTCSTVTENTLPCSGTFACLCKQGDKQYYRLSKTMPTIPQNYTGLNTTLSDSWIDQDIIVQDDEDEGWTTEKILIYVGVISGCALVFGYVCYYMVTCAVNSYQGRNKVSYLDKDKNGNGTRA